MKILRDGPPKPLITRSDAVMSGTVIFAGTRVPVQTLLDYLEEGGTLDSFLKDRLWSSASWNPATAVGGTGSPTDTLQGLGRGYRAA